MSRKKTNILSLFGSRKKKEKALRRSNAPSSMRQPYPAVL